MNIKGKRVFLRAVEISDRDVLLSIINDENIENGLGGWSFPVSELQQEDWIRSLKLNDKTLRCMIVSNADNQAVGTVILSDIDYKNGTAEIHIKIMDQGQGKGFGSESISLLASYAFNELRLNCIYAYVNSYNEASQTLFEKQGFIKDGDLRGRIFKRGQFHNVYSYSLLKGDLNGNRK
ncbi:MAG: GNAT family protein [Oscillospiraceae bacterium]|nr:GNAT family protein [Oscillospiraceae bacterium]